MSDNRVIKKINKWEPNDKRKSKQTLNDSCCRGL